MVFEIFNCSNDLRTQKTVFLQVNANSHLHNIVSCLIFVQVTAGTLLF
jgi:hypothetical protein